MNTPVSSPLGQQKKALLQGIAALLIAALICMIVLKVADFDLEKIKEILRGSQTRWVLFGVLGSVVLHFTQAIRWWAILYPVTGTGIWPIFQSKFVGFAANSILPARVGDLVRFEYVSRRLGLPRGKIIATGIVDLWFDKLGWVICFAVLALIEPPVEWVFKAMLVMMGIILAVLAVLVGFWKSNLGRSENEAGKFRQFLFHFRSGLSGQKLGKQFVIQLLVSPLSWLWETVVLMQTAKAVGLDLGFKEAFTLLTGFNLAMVIPSVGNAGTFELSSMLVLVSLGYPRETSFAFGLLYHLTQLVPGILLGVLFFSRMKANKK